MTITSMGGDTLLHFGKILVPQFFVLRGIIHYGYFCVLSHHLPLSEKPSSPGLAHLGTHLNQSVHLGRNHRLSVFMQSFFVLSETVLIRGLTVRPQVWFLVTLSSPTPSPPSLCSLSTARLPFLLPLGVFFLRLLPMLFCSLRFLV